MASPPDPAHDAATSSAAAVSSQPVDGAALARPIDGAPLPQPVRRVASPEPLGASIGPIGYVRPLLRMPAIRWDGDVASTREEALIEETPVALVYNQVPHVVMMCTPTDLEDFAVGFSLTEELIRSAADVRELQVVRHARGIEVQLTVDAACDAIVSERTRRLTGRTGCGICGADSVEAVLKTRHAVRPGLPVSGRAIHAAFEALQARQALNAEAGAVHAAGWARGDGTLTVVREDVGRHNALDKLIGALVRDGASPDDGFVVVTSRASFEMVQKSCVLGAPLLAAISGPTALAVRVAEASGLTLVGFTRKGGHTVYTHPRRVTA
jgi:FdhD protein